MSPEERGDIAAALIVVPRDECDGCVKAGLFHLVQKAPVAQAAVWLRQPRIVDGQIGVILVAVPAVGSAGKAKEGQDGNDADEIGASTRLKHVRGVPNRMAECGQENGPLTGLELTVHDV